MPDLLQLIAERRDAQAFADLFRMYAPRIKSYMMRQGADAATAEELAQEALMTVWRKAALYTSDKGSAATWIFTIARNLRIDRLRRETVWQELPEGREEEAAGDPLPDESLQLGETGARIRLALAGLTPEQSQVVSMSYLDGLSHSEIAARLSLPLGTVKSRMRLAYQKMRAELGDYEP